MGLGFHVLHSLEIELEKSKKDELMDLKNDETNELVEKYRFAGRDKKEEPNKNYQKQDYILNFHLNKEKPSSKHSYAFRYNAQLNIVEEYH